VYRETLSNPQLRLIDIPPVAEAARAVGVAVVIDNTFATPHCTRPLELGAAAVVDS
jgi:cystathionine beta-lyase/cystathionine gamma-synthase